uniref:Uncharacterized protein n=1 Tax=Oryza barthii TaxID=65489 RepID=A0A0D3GJH2_9ORYZ
MVLHSSGEGQHAAVCHLLDEMPLPPGPLELFSGAAASPISRHLQRRARRVRVVGWGRSWRRIFASHLVEETQHGRSQHMYNEFAVTSKGLLPNTFTRNMFNVMLKMLAVMSRSGCTPNRVTCRLEQNAGRLQEAGYGGYVTQVLQGMKSCDWPTAQSIVSKILNKPNDQSYSDPVLCKGWQCSWDRSSQKEVYDCTIFPSWVILRTLVTANFKCRWLEGIEKAF